MTARDSLCGRWLINKHLPNPLRSSGREGGGGHPRAQIPYQSPSPLFQVETRKDVWPEPRLHLGHHDSSPPSPTSSSSSSSFTRTSTSTSTTTTPLRSNLPRFYHRWWMTKKRNRELKVESIKLRVSCWRLEGGEQLVAHWSVALCEKGGGGLPLSPLSPIDGDTCQWEVTPVPLIRTLCIMLAAPLVQW